MSQVQSFNIENNPFTPNIEFLAGNSGGPIGPNPTTFVINVVGDNATGINVVGVPIGNSLVISSTTSITGTQHQVLVNNGFGTPTFGPITLTTPQDIDTTSSPTFDNLTLTGNLNLPASNAAGTAGIVNFGGTQTMMVVPADFNVFVGPQSGNLGYTFGTATGNTSLGAQTLNALTTGTNNTATGFKGLLKLTTGTGNSAYGDSTLDNLLTGSYNIAFGYSSGSAYTSSESSNILINNSGVLGESNVLRIGAGTGVGNQQISSAYVSGIQGVTTASGSLVTVNSSDQLASIANGTAGQILTSNGTSTPSFKSPMGIFNWSDASGIFSALNGNGYFITGTSTVTLPATATEGTTISFVVDTTQILTITANTGQMIRVGSDLSAAAGTAVNNSRGDSIELVYRLSTTTWFCFTSPQGTWTVT